MHRFGRWIVASFVISAFACSLGLAQSAEELEAVKKKLESVEAQVRALEAQVKALEARLGPAPAAAAATAPAAPAPTPAMESEAQALVSDIPRLADQGQIEQARGKLAELKTRYAGTKAAGQAGYFTRELDVVGKAAPADWGIDKWIQGEKGVDLSGKPTTLVVFWEEWCPHCREEMPKLQRLWASKKDKGLQILGATKITQTSTEEKVRSFLGENKISFPVMKENGSLSSWFSVGGIPAAAIVKGGKVVWRGHPIRLTDEVISRWL